MSTQVSGRGSGERYNVEFKQKGATRLCCPDARITISNVVSWGSKPPLDPGKSMNPLKMTLSGVRLHQPPHQEAGEQLVYGLGLPIQISPTEVAVMVNIRNTGVPVVDFENGWDIMIFDNLDQIRAERAIKGVRNTPAIHPHTGRKLTMVHIVPTVGFVPLGAKLADGRPHPHQGTGFGITPVVGYPADNSQLNAHVATDKHEYCQLLQFRYDGRKFEITRIDKIDNLDECLPGWEVKHGTLGPALAEGEDLLFGLVAQRSSRSEGNAEDASGANYGSGFSRWRYGSDGWRPVDFLQLTTARWMPRPSLRSSAIPTAHCFFACAAAWISVSTARRITAPPSRAPFIFLMFGLTAPSLFSKPATANPLSRLIPIKVM